MKRLISIIILTQLTFLNADNYSLSFDGDDDYVNLSDDILLNDPESFTIMIYLKDLIYDLENYSEPFIIGTGEGGHWMIRAFPSEDKIKFSVYIGGTWHAAETTNEYDGAWHSLAAVYSRTDGQITLYKDGLLSQSTSIPTSSLYNHSSWDYVALGGGFGSNINGKLDELSIWNTALSQSEIQSYLTTSPTGSESGLIAYWNFNEGTGTTLTDQTANGNDGTIYGATWSTDVPGAVTYYVATDGSDDNDGSENSPFATIQAGIDAASNGDTVLVEAGTYVENINYNGKNIAVIGEDRETTIIDGSQNGGVVTFNSGEDSTTVLNRFTIQNGFKEGNEGSVFPDDYSGAGIFIGYNSHPKIMNCKIINNTSADEGGGIFINGSSPTLYNLEILNNYAPSFGGGLWCGGNDASSNNSPSNIVANNLLVSNNESETGAGIYIVQSNYQIDVITVNNNSSTSESAGIYTAESNGSISNATISNNISDYGGELFVGLGAAQITNCIVYGSDYTDEFLPIFYESGSELEILFSNIQGGWEGTGNIDANPLFCNPDSDDYTLAENSPCVGTGENSANMGALDVGCEALILAPVLTDIDDQQITEDGSVTLEISATSAMGLDMTFSVHSDSSDVIVSFDNTTLTATPEPDWWGSTPITVIVTDENSLSDTTSFGLEVLPVNDAPVIAAIVDTSMEEDSVLSLELSATDVDGDYLSFSVDPIDNIEAYIFADGDSLMLVPDGNWHGVTDVNLSVIDGDGLSDNTSFVLTVNPVDDDPFVDGYLEDIYMYEDSQDSLEVDLSDLFTDIDGELTFGAEILDTSVIGVNIDGDLLHLFTLADANGETQMIVTASNPTRASVSDTVMVTVFAVNDAPVLLALDSIVMDEDQTFGLLSMAELMEAGILTDIDNSIEDISFELYTDNDQIHVQWNGDPSSNPMLVPDENYNGAGTLILCVNDGEYEVCAENTVTITPVNDAPMFVSDLEAVVGLGLEFHVDLQVGDIDSETLVVSLVDGPIWLSLTDDTLRGTPTELGMFPVELSLTDGELTVIDTFDFHVENFTPQIIEIADVPNDQGGRVYLGFNGSFLDNGVETGQSYSVFRWDTYDDQENWVLVQSGDAIGQPFYVYEVTTVMDSTVEGPGLTNFMVVASMNNGIFASLPMMGYSVDNIHPGVPAGVMAVVVDNTVELSWNESIDEDFQYFIIEKTSFDMVELIETADAFYMDADYVSSEIHHYRIAAVDHSGNQSDYSDMVDVAVLAIDDQLTPEVFALHQNYPNPFNPVTQIKYDLPEASHVQLFIYDILGREVTALVNEVQEPGYRSITWHGTDAFGRNVGAGMYFYSIQAGDFRQVKKMVLLK